MSKIVINRNLAKYYYKFVDNVFKPLSTLSTVSTTAGATTSVSALREVVVVKESTLTTLNKIASADLFKTTIERLGWFTTDASNTNPYTKGIAEQTYDFGKVVTIVDLTTIASASNPTGFPTGAFKLYTSTNGTDWVEAYSSTATYTVEHIHTLNLSTRYLKMTVASSSINVFVSPTKGFTVIGYNASTNSVWNNDLSVILTSILTDTTRATTLTNLVTSNVITQAEKDAFMMIPLTDRPVITSSLDNNGVVSVNLTNPNKFVRRYVKSTDNSTNETMYLLFPYYTTNLFNTVVHQVATYYTYNTTSSATTSQAFSYIAVSIGTTGTEDLVLDYTDNIDYLDDVTVKIQLPKTI